MQEELIDLIKSWLRQAGALIRKRQAQDLKISNKSSRNDLVTNVDQEVQDFLVEKILTKFPQDQILGEENGRNQLLKSDVRTWVIDPIDGTLNFVLQKENFAIMIGVLEPKNKKLVGKLGFIYDVVKDELYYGGAGFGVYCNEQKLVLPPNTSAYDGLWLINGKMFGHNQYFLRDFVEKTMGVRIIGSAAMEFISVLKGQCVGYVSYNQPWDYTAGMILAQELGLEFSSLPQEEIDFSKAIPMVVGTVKAMNELMIFLEKNL